MIILMNCLSSISGGAIAYLHNLSHPLSERFAASKGKNELIFLAHESQRELLSGAPDSHYYWIKGTQPRGWRRVVWERRNLDRIVSETETEILFSPYQIAPSSSGVKQVLMLRNMEPFLFGQYRYSLHTALRNRLLARASRQSLRRANRIIAVSGFARDYLTNTLSIAPACIRTIYHGRSETLANSGKVEQDHSLLAELGVNKRFILTPGSLLPYRRCEDVIRAFDLTADKLPDDMQLVIAGSGNDQRYTALIRKSIARAVARSRILLTGHVPWDKMAALYRQCNACVIATEIEACPNIAIEAMTTGCAIIATNKPPLPEMFDNAYHSYRARDIPHLAEMIIEVVGDEKLRKTLTAHSLKRAKDFSWATCADQTYAALTNWA